MSAAASPNQNIMLDSITASLEKSLKKCSLNNHQQGSLASSAAEGMVYSSSSSSDSSPAGNPARYSDAASLDLNSQISLPYHWEQCLDLKSGEIYFINWTTGMKAREDPRTNPQKLITTHVYSTDEEEEEEEAEAAAAAAEEEEEEEEEEEDDSRSSGSSYYEERGVWLKFKTSPPAGEGASLLSWSDQHQQNMMIRCNEEVCSLKGDINEHEEGSGVVLVVAGCKVCLMYFMVPKQVQYCPKCTNAQLLHFL